MLQFLKESTLLILCFCTGAYYFRTLTLFYRLLFFQVAFAFISFLLARVIVYYQQLHHLPLNNHWVYNVYILLESLLLLGGAFVLFKRSPYRYYIAAPTLLVVSVWTFYMGQFGIHHFANNVMVAESISLSVLYLIILNRCIQDPDFNWRKSSDFWVSLGIVLYFACNVPFMGLMYYLYSNYPKLTEVLFHVITDVFGNVRYLLATVGFYLLSRQSAVFPSLRT